MFEFTPNNPLDLARLREIHWIDRSIDHSWRSARRWTWIAIVLTILSIYLMFRDLALGFSFLALAVAADGRAEIRENRIARHTIQPPAKEKSPCS